jgi:hypothetical protein
MNTRGHTQLTRVAVRVVRTARREDGFIGIGLCLIFVAFVSAIGLWGAVARSNASVMCPYALPSVLVEKANGISGGPQPDTQGCSLTKIADAFKTQSEDAFSAGLFHEVTGGALDNMLPSR